MKYIKKYENIEWDWLDEEESTECKILIIQSAILFIIDNKNYFLHSINKKIDNNDIKNKIVIKTINGYDLNLISVYIGGILEFMYKLFKISNDNGIYCTGFEDCFTIDYLKNISKNIIKLNNDLSYNEFKKLF
jgi:hypothetical protein